MATPLKGNFAIQLYKLMRLLGLTTAEAGRILGVTSSAIRTYKAKGTSASPRQVANLIEVAKASGYSVDLEYFYLSEDDPASYSHRRARELNNAMDTELGQYVLEAARIIDYSRQSFGRYKGESDASAGAFHHGSDGLKPLVRQIDYILLQALNYMTKAGYSDNLPGQVELNRATLPKD